MKASASNKLMGSVVLLVGLALVMGVVSLTVNYRLGSQLDLAVNDMARAQMVAAQISSETTEMVASERGLAFAMMLQQTGEAEAMRNRFGRSEEKIRELMREFEATRRAMSSSNDLSRVASNYEAARAHHSKLVQLLSAQKMEEAIAMLNGKLLPELSKMSDEAKKVVERQRGEMTALKASAEATRTGSIWSIAGLNVFCLAVGVMVFFTVRGVNRALRQMVAELSSGAQQLGSTSEEVSSYSMTLAKAASDQAASLEETSSSTEVIHSMTRSNAANSKEAAARMQEATAKVEEASRALGEMMESMNEISNSSNKISKIIKVIDEIAFQTNILALNAAVEAARAGEAGMGFAVVADEVRNLSQRSAQAAKDTTLLIEESIMTSNGGRMRLDEVARASEAVNALVKTVTSLVQEVRLGSEEQERGAEQIARSVSQMQTVTQQVAANAEEGAAAGQQLKQHASGVERIVLSLQALVGTSSVAAVAPPSLPSLTFARQKASAPARVEKFTASKPVSRFQAEKRPSASSSSATALLDDPFPMEGDFKDF